MLLKLRGLTLNYYFYSDILQEALELVYNDPKSNKSWNLL